MPIPRIRIPASQLSQPIPSLSERQYVVDKSRKSPDQIKLERELFWYRDALLKTLDATWVEVRIPLIISSCVHVMKAEADIE